MGNSADLRDGFCNLRRGNRLLLTGTGHVGRQLQASQVGLGPGPRRGRKEGPRATGRVHHRERPVPRVREAGGTVIDAPSQQSYGRSALCTDDQGTRFYLGEF